MQPDAAFTTWLTLPLLLVMKLLYGPIHEAHLPSSHQDMRLQLNSVQVTGGSCMSWDKRPFRRRLLALESDSGQ